MVVSEATGADPSVVERIATEGRWHVYQVGVEKKSFFGLLRSRRQVVRVVDDEGVIRLQKDDAKVLVFTKGELMTSFSDFVDSMTLYSDAGATLPKTYLFFGQRMSDLSGVINKEQMLSLAEMELEFTGEDQPIIAVAARD